MTDYSDLPSMLADLSTCRACAEAGYDIYSMPIVAGQQAARLMVVGQAPSGADAESNIPFTGEAGSRLFDWLKRAGWDDEESFRQTAYITSVTKCFPGEKENGSGDRQASAKERKLCRKWLDAEIALVRPEVIVPVGSLAVKLFYPPQLQLADVIGESMIDAQGRHIVPLPHPSGASRWLNNPHNVGRLEQALYRLRTLKADLGL